MAYRITLDACMDACIECDTPDEALLIVKAIEARGKEDAQLGCDEKDRVQTHKN